MPFSWRPGGWESGGSSAKIISAFPACRWCSPWPRERGGRRQRRGTKSRARSVLLGVLFLLWTAWWISMPGGIRALNHQQLPPHPRRDQRAPPERLVRRQPAVRRPGLCGAPALRGGSIMGLHPVPRPFRRTDSKRRTRRGSEGYRFERRSATVNSRASSNWRLADADPSLEDREVCPGEGTLEQLVIGTGSFADCTPIVPASIASVRRWRSAWGGNRSGSYVITSWGEYCEEHSGERTGPQRGPEAEISLRRQHAAEYQEQDSERCSQQQEKTGPANAGAPPPPNQDLPQQYRSNHQDQECGQEDRVANLALGSASRHCVELDAVPQAIAASASAETTTPACPNRPNRSRPNDQS